MKRLSFLTLILASFFLTACNETYKITPASMATGDSLCKVTATPFGFGEGSLSNPYRICSATHFLALSSYLSSGLHFRQTANLDFTSVTFQPIGDGVIPFNGNYDGRNFSINNVSYVNAADTVPSGVFRLLGSESLVENIVITGLITTGNDHTGGLAGRAEGTIQNVNLTGTINGNANVGGIVGSQSSDGLEISNSTVAGIINSTATSLIISNSATGPISDTTGVGGIIGVSQHDMTITGCRSIANVNWAAGRGIYASIGAGGIAGTSAGENTVINYSSSSGSVSSPFDAAGIVGLEYSSGPYVTANKTNALIEYVWTDAIVTGTNGVAGIVAYHSGATISKSYSLFTYKMQLFLRMLPQV